MHQPSWEAVNNEDMAPEPGTVPQVQGEDVTKNRSGNVEDCPEHRRISSCAKAALNQLVLEELSMLHKEPLDNIFRSSSHNAQSWNWSCPV